MDFKQDKETECCLFPAHSFHELLKLNFQSFPIYTQLSSLKNIPTLRLNRTDNELTSFAAPATVSFSPLTYICFKNILHYRYRNLVKETATDRYSVWVAVLAFF